MAVEEVGVERVHQSRRRYSLLPLHDTILSDVMEFRNFSWVHQVSCVMF